MNPPFFHLPSPDLLLPCHAAQGPPVPQSLLEDEAKSAVTRKTHVWRQKTNNAFLFFKLNKGLFIVFNSLPKKLVFKTLLWSLFTWCYIQNQCQPKLSATVTANMPSCWGQ